MMYKIRKRFLLLLVFSLVLTQPAYAADGSGGLTGFLNSVFNAVQELFAPQETNTNDDNYTLPFDRALSTPEVNETEGLPEGFELTDDAAQTYNITFHANGGKYYNIPNPEPGHETETISANSYSVEITSHNLSATDTTQVVDLYDSSVHVPKFFSEDRMATESDADAGKVIFIGYSEAVTGPIIRTRDYQPKANNIELWAQWIKVEDPTKQYKVTYNSGIGRFRTQGLSSNATIEKSITCGEFAPDIVPPYTSDSNNPFVGWYLETEPGDFQSASDYVQPRATKVYRDMAFTARFAYDDTNTYEYYIKFMANGGQFSNGDQYKYVRVMRDEPGVLPDSPTRAGFKFNGWSQSASDQEGLHDFPNPYHGAPDAEDAATHGYDNPFIYYACWDGEATGVTRDVTVTLQPNGGTFGVLTDGWLIDGNGFCYQTSTIVDTATMTVDLNTFPAISREGYTFKGWSLDGSTAYTDSTFTTGYSRSFTALWVKNNSDPSGGGGTPAATNYILTFDANGGSFSNHETTAKVTVASGSPITYPEEQPTREAYKFAGWATTATATEPSDLSNLRVTGNAKLYAVWNLKDVGIPTQVQLVMGDGYYNNKAGTSTIVTDIGTPISQFYTKSTRKGYTLKGFSNAPNSTEVLTKTAQVEEDMVLYAVWLEGGSGGGDDPDPDPIVSYKIVFDANGGYYDNDVTHLTYTVSVDQGDKLSTVPTPKLDNGTFLGYGTEINSTAVIDMTNIIPEADSTYYAVWDSKGDEYKVTFIAGDNYGGSKFSNNSQTQEVKVKANEKVNQPEVPLETRNLSFSYWSETKSASWTGTSSVAFNFNQTIKKDTTLYAIYRSVDNSSKFRTVTFDYNGGKLRTKESISVDVLYNYPVEKPESPKRKDYTFKGWYTETDGASEDKWDFDNPVTEDMTLYAVWKDKKSTTSSSSSKTTSNTTSTGTSANGLATVQSVTPQTNLAQGGQNGSSSTTGSGGTNSSSDEKSTTKNIPRTGISYPVQIQAMLILLLLCAIIIVSATRRKHKGNE